MPCLVPYPPEILLGCRNFCIDHHFEWRQIPEISRQTEIGPGDAFIVIEENDLVNLVKESRQLNLLIGNDIGIISYNDTPLKEILLDGITVISTDHAKMGETAATLILEDRKEKIRNPFTLIRRKSL